MLTTAWFTKFHKQACLSASSNCGFSLVSIAAHPAHLKTGQTGQAKTDQNRTGQIPTVSMPVYGWEWGRVKIFQEIFSWWVSCRIDVAVIRACTHISTWKWNTEESENQVCWHFQQKNGTLWNLVVYNLHKPPFETEIIVSVCNISFLFVLYLL